MPAQKTEFSVAWTFRPRVIQDDIDFGPTVQL